MLHEAGAVFYCKTNVPQTLMPSECVNFISGRTSTLWNTDLSAGGPSGGEGSPIALGGSPLGVGSDIAGSIRTPANFNGIYGLCPLTGRFPAHCADKTSSDSYIKGVYGPLARGVDELELCARTILSMRPWERNHEVLRIPWQEDDYQEGLGKKHKLCFGFMPHDNVVLPDPPIRRCMDDIRQKIETAGHQTIDIEPFDGVELCTAMFKIFGATGSKDVHDVAEQSGETLIREIELSTIDSAISAWERNNLGAQLGVLRQKYLQRIADTSSNTKSGLPIDGIILPSGGHVAPPHGTMEYYTYEAISNGL
ncbi:amidase signature domain-containing protein [Phaeosphaeriaceae sp. PMI808]|nr:amidase signature domain-containing protein [Phaeosphaeriaceae sp. PMI808]